MHLASFHWQIINITEHVIVFKKRTRWYKKQQRVVDLLNIPCLMAVTWYLWPHHYHIQVSLVVGDDLAHICNNLSGVARYIRSVQCNDNSLDDVLVCSMLLPAWHLAESCAHAKVFGMGNGLMCASLWWPNYYASTERMLGRSPDHWDIETLRLACFTKHAQNQILIFEFHM